MPTLSGTPSCEVPASLLIPEEPGPSTRFETKVPKRRSTTIMVVEMYNIADVPGLEIAKAQRVASALFSNAGIKVEWTNCPLSGRPKCNDSKDSFIVSIIGVSPSTIPQTAMAYAAPFSGLENRAAVIYPRVVVHSRQNPEVLAGVLIAHELAHLILHTNSHGEGILRQVWTQHDVTVAALLRLRFTREQARCLRRGLERIRDLLWRRHKRANRIDAPLSGGFEGTSDHSNLRKCRASSRW